MQTIFEGRRRRLLCAALALGAFSGLAFADDAHAQRAEPCIGASWELTGAFAHQAQQIRYGAEAAIDEINERGGVLGQRLRLVAYDDQGEPARAVDNARRIGERDNCIAMLGGFRTPNAIALREPLHEMGLPWVGTISAGTAVIEFPTNKWMFRVSMKDRWVAGFLLDRAREASKSGKVGMVYEATAWGQGGLADAERAASERGVTLAAKETYNMGDADMSAQLIRLRDAGVDAIVLYGNDREVANLLRSMDRLGYRPAIFAAWGIGARLAELAGPLAEGVRVAGTFSWLGELPERAKPVLARMQAKFPEIRTTADLLHPSGTANAYDAVHIIAEAIRIAGRFDRGAVREAMYKVNWTGLVADYRPAFEPRPERHDAVTPAAYRLFAYHNGKLLPVEQTPHRLAARTN
jgi:branched-chain amino acid transport system substrate-binding protein